MSRKIMSTRASIVKFFWNNLASLRVLICRANILVLPYMWYNFIISLWHFRSVRGNGKHCNSLQSLYLFKTVCDKRAFIHLSSRNSVWNAKILVVLLVSINSFLCKCVPLKNNFVYRLPGHSIEENIIFEISVTLFAFRALESIFYV